MLYCTGIHGGNMMSNNKITPRKLSGFMELPPEKQIIFDNMKDKIKKVFDRNCFMPLDTPVLEYAEILLAKSGGEIDKEIYHFKKGDSELAMRYDLTVPLARFVAMNIDTLNFPFKRYQIGKVYRGEKAQKGRFREFYQCDADIIGNEQLPLVADAECVNIIYEIYKELNINAIVNISNRNILFGLVEDYGYSDKASQILTILDKLNKIGKDNAFKGLCDIGINTNHAEKLIASTLKSGNFDTILKEIELLSKNDTFLKGIAELKELYGYIKAYNIPENKYCLNIGIIRGQNYYTGTVFEAFSVEHPEFSSIAGGGRYDNLAEYYTDKKLPGVGMSIGFTRLFDLLDTHNMLQDSPCYPADVIIIPMGNTINTCLSLATDLKAHDIKAEVNYDERSFKAKLKDANRKEVPYVIIVGENEVATGKYTLKDMKNSEQFNLTKEECINKVKAE